MINIKDTRFQNTATFLKNAVEIAEYYGFVSIQEINPRAKITVSGRKKRIATKDISFVRKDERFLVPVVHKCSSLGLGDSLFPSLFWRYGPIIRTGKNKYTSIELHIVGVPNAIAEALLLSVANAIIEDSGIRKSVIHINSMGLTDSSNRYARDLSLFLKKHLIDLPTTLRAKVSTEPMSVLMQLSDHASELVEKAPNSLEYLNEEERRHFWDLLEYLETTNINYELNTNILGSPDCWVHSLFNIHNEQEDTNGSLIATGGRYDTLMSKCVGAGAAAVNLNIMCEISGRTRFQTHNKRKSPKLYFAHLGPEAKKMSLPILELLRQSRIPIYQSLIYENISEQMGIVKKLKVPYMLIMGHKEATEGTVLIRDVHTNSQQTIKTDSLIGHLGRMRLSQK